MGGAYLSMVELRNANKIYLEQTWNEEISAHVSPLDRPRYAKDSNGQIAWRLGIIIYTFTMIKQIIYAFYSVNILNL
jgi:hypothetical protein